MCQKNEHVTEAMAEPGKNFDDFQSVLASKDDKTGECFNCKTGQPCEGDYWLTRKYQGHNPLTYQMYLHSNLPSFKSKNITYVGPDADQHIVSNVTKTIRKFYNELPEPVPIIFNKADRKKFRNQGFCYSYNKPFDDSNIKSRKVRDHCNFTEKFRGAMHSSCNLKIKYQQIIPVIFHNFIGISVVASV